MFFRKRHRCQSPSRSHSTFSTRLTRKATATTITTVTIMVTIMDTTTDMITGTASVISTDCDALIYVDENTKTRKLKMPEHELLRR
jgi:hypothetical protein